MAVKLLELPEKFLRKPEYQRTWWFGDGSSYPGLDSFWRRSIVFRACLGNRHGVLPLTATLPIEYKLLAFRAHGWIVKIAA